MKNRFCAKIYSKPASGKSSVVLCIILIMNERDVEKRDFCQNFCFLAHLYNLK